MKNTCLTIFLSITSFICFGQTEVLKKMNFDNGSWKIFGIANSNSKNTLQDSLGDFFVKNIDVLKQIQKTWMLKKDSTRMHNFQYELRFVQNDTNVYSVQISLDEKKFTGREGCYVFPDNMLRQFSSKLKHITKTEYKVNGLENVRKLCKQLKQIDTVYFSSYGSEFYLNFDGEMKISVRDSIVKNGTKLYSAVYSKIKKDHPKQSFVLKPGNVSHATGATDIYEYALYCSQEMSKELSSYVTVKAWKPYDKFLIRVYGMTKEQIDNLAKVK